MEYSHNANGQIWMTLTEPIAAILMGTPSMVYMPIITISLNPNPPGIGTTEIIHSKIN